jgi:release factor glutamine methyltransferase
MIIREIQPKDNASIETIMTNCFKEFGLPTVGSSLEDADVKQMYEGFQSNKAVYYIVEEQGKVLGGGGVKQLQGAANDTCELQKMYFHPNARGKGFGKKIFDLCLNAARGFGFEFCYLESHSELKAAIRLYEMNGFEHLKKPLGNTGHIICGVYMLKKNIMILKSLKTYFSEALLGYYPETEIGSFFNLLSEQILKMKRIDISQNLYAVVSGKKYEKFQVAVERLRNYEPIQYILGDTEFYGLVFKVNPSVLIPRPETEELVHWIIDCHSGQGKESRLNILDIGTGSGCIAISLAKNLPNAKVFALDVSEKALKTAKENALKNNVEVEFIQEDILNLCHAEQVSASQAFDIIVSNPPYVCELEKDKMSANVLDHEPHLALFVKDDDALLFYRKISELAKKVLKPNGILYFEINENLGEITKTLLINEGFCDIELKIDTFEKERMLKAIKP